MLEPQKPTITFHNTCLMSKDNSYAFSVYCMLYTKHWNLFSHISNCVVKLLPTSFRFEQTPFELGLNQMNSSFVPWLQHSVQPLNECSWYLQESVRLMQIGHHTTSFICHLNALAPRICGSNSNTLRHWQYTHYFADGIFDNIWISIKILLKFICRCPIGN